MPSSFNLREDVFPEAINHWDLDRLYTDLSLAKQRPLTHTERVCLRGLLQGINPHHIAAALNRQPQGLRVDLTRGLYRYIEALTQVTVKNWREVAAVLGPYKQSNPVVAAVAVSPSVSSVYLDWGKAPDVFAFFGRKSELAQLEQWIVDDRCRVAAIRGMGGMGKTSLALKLAQQIQEQFQYIVWRSLLDAPRPQDFITDVLQTLSGQQAIATLTDLDSAISRLLNHLKAHRCLLILDNVETVLQAEALAGQYRPGYEGYGQMLQQIGTVPHQSSLLLTGREMLREIGQLEGKLRPVRSLRLGGLAVREGKQIFAEIGEFTAGESEWQQLIDLYSGNPLLLELVGKQIADVFDGDIAAFMNAGTPLFHDLQELLDWHFNRLTPLEQEVMYWLAINREPMTIAELKEDLLSPIAQKQVATTLQLLQRRFPLERKGQCFTQQSVVMEYVTQRLIERVCSEIAAGEIQDFNQYAIVKAQAKDYIRESQKRILVEPILANLQTQFHTRTAIVAQLQQVLQVLRDRFADLGGYGGGNLINLLCQLNVDLSGYDFSRLSLWQAHLADVQLHSVNLSGADLAKSVFAETFGGISSVAFSPDAQRLATSDTSGEVQVWNRITGQQLLTLRADTVWTWAAAFSTDGQILATAGDDYQVKLWDAQSGDCLKMLPGHSNTINAIAFSPTAVNSTAFNSTDSLLASCGQDATIRLWAVNSRTPQKAHCVGVLTGHQGRVWSIAFSPDGKTIVSGSEDCTIKLWDVQTGTCFATWSGHDRWIKSVACSADGEWIASGSFDGVVKVWQTRSGECVQSWRSHQNTVTSVAFSPIAGRSPLLASSSYDQTVKFWDISSGICLKTWQAHSNRIWFVAFSPDGQLLASGGEDHATRLWDVQSGYCCKTWKGHTNGILALANAPDGGILATGQEDQTVKLWHPHTGEIQKTLRGHKNRVWSIAFAPAFASADHSVAPILASASADRTLKLWNSQTGDCLRTLEGHQSWVWSVTFSPDGSRIASASYDQTIRLWDSETGNCLQILSGHSAPIVSVAFSPDGEWLASGSFDTLIKLWHLPSGQCVSTMQGHQQSVWAVAFSPDGRHLASCSYDNTVKLWNVDRADRADTDHTDTNCIHTLAEHTAPVVCLAFSPDGSQLASGSFDRTVCLWDVRSGNLQHRFAGHRKPVCALLFRAAPHLQILSSSFDETIRCWDAVTGNCLAVWREHRPYEAMNIAEVKGLTESQRATLLALGAVA